MPLVKSSFYKLRKPSKMDSTDAQSLRYFVAVFDIGQLVYMIKQFLFSFYKRNL